MTRYAPDSGFFFVLTSDKRNIQRGWKHIPSKILLLVEEGKQNEVQA
jgi:hypothetical protein